jgi:hypothetical protein
MIDWPDVTGLVKVVWPLTVQGGHFLVEPTDVLEYYLPNTSWRQWSHTQSGDLRYFKQAIARHYFSLMVLGFNETPAAGYGMAFDLSTAVGYSLTAKVRSGRQLSTCGST